MNSSDFFKRRRAALALAACSALAASAADVSLSSRLRYDDGAFETRSLLRGRNEALKVFAGIETRDEGEAGAGAPVFRYEMAGAIIGGNVFEVSLGNLTKPPPLSRLENPVPAAYSGAAGGLSVPGAGGKSGAPTALGSHPWASAVWLALPSPAGIPLTLGGEGYWAAGEAGGGAAGGRITASGESAGRAARFQASVGAYTYRLEPKAEESWFLTRPYFAPGDVTAVIAEGSLRARLSARTPPLLVYGAGAVTETPSGGAAPWGRAEAALPLPAGKGRVTLKGKLFYAPLDFYTPKNAVSPARTKCAVNAQAAFPVRGAALGGGAAFAWDSAARLCGARGALTFARGRFSAALDGFWNGWKLTEGGEAETQSGTTAGGKAALSAAFPRVSGSVSGGYTIYPRNLPELKADYTAALTVTPRPAGKAGRGVRFTAAPECRMAYTGKTRRGAGSGEVSASAAWKLRVNGVAVTVRAEAALGVQPAD